MNTILKTKTNTDIKLFHDDICLCDASRGFAVTASRKGGVRSLGGSLLEILDTDTKDVLRERLFSFDSTPFKITTRLGEATVYNSIFHSSLLFIVQFKNDEFATDIACLEQDSMLSNAPPSNALYKRVIEISEFCGCPVNVTIDESKVDEPLYDELISTFDMPLFTAFLISILLLARRASRDRHAEIKIKEEKESPLISVSFEPLDSSVTSYEELSPLINISEQLHLLFYRKYENGKIEISFKPVRKNWALLGIKTPLDFTWDDEEPKA